MGVSELRGQGSDTTTVSPVLVDGALTVGFLALGVAVLVAYLQPSTAYELSIYAATPALFWAGVGVALSVALGVTVGVAGYRRVGGAGLAVGAFVAVAALPLLRGYHFYGAADALTHLGYVRDIASGRTGVAEFFYPGVHTLALAISDGTGFSEERALLFVVFVTAVVFVTFVPLVVRAMVDSEFATSLGVFAGLLLLPINHVAVHYMEPHSMSQTILLFPLLLYLLVVSLTSDAEGGLITRAGVLLALVSFATVLYHPLQAAMVLLLFGTVAGLQFVVRRVRPTHSISGHRRVYGQTVFLAVAYALWTFGKPRFRDTAGIVEGELQSFLLGGGARAGAVVGRQSDSLAAVGSGLGDLFLRLFLVGAVFAAFAGLFAIRTVLARFEVPATGSQYLVGALFTFVPASLVLFVGDVSKLAFRLLGSTMVIVTVLGTVFLYRVVADSSGGTVNRAGRVAVIVVLAAMLAHSLAIVYASPYVYKANPQVTEAQVTGYENAFEMGASGIEYAGVRGGSGRYMQAIYGSDSVPDSLDLAYHQQRGTISGENMTRIAQRYDEDRYLVVSRRDVERELGAYGSLRYNRSQLTAVRTQPTVHRIRSNGAVDLYLHVEPDVSGTEG
ncbi:hypothetical protein ACOZ4N_20425 (plasmid) [Halorientalis pallida]|uniref:hypothetical protein n=1 Tax=Halorientalis pallida TaxID=2479928 RepID=UPI003C6F1AE1